MRVISLSVIFISVITVFAFVNAFPTDNDVRQNTLSDIYEITPDKIPDSTLSDETTAGRRVKRQDIIGFIRLICPPLANFLNNAFQQVKKLAFKIIGKLLLGGNKQNAGNKEKPAVVVNLPTYPPDEDETTEPTTDSDSSSSSDSSSTESSSSSDSSSTETSPSSESSSSESSSPPVGNSISNKISSKSDTTSTTESHPKGHSNSISTNEFQVDELMTDYDYQYDC